MDEITLRDRTSGSVWGVAAFAVAVFIVIVLFGGLFGGTELAASTTAAVN